MNFLTLAILSISMITVMASAAVSPALANIANAFPETNINMIKTVLTIPSLFIIPFSLISSVLVKKYGNKKVLMFGILVYIFGGIAPAFADSIYSLLFFRAALGCGCGLIMPISQSLIALNFEGERRAKITGYSAAASYLMGVIASFVVAPVSAVNWHFSFYIYLIAVGVLVLNIIALPNDAPVKAKAKRRQKLPGGVWVLIGGMFLLNIAFYAVPANVALFMKENGIGKASSAGTVISAFMISGFIAGITLAYIRKFFDKYTASFGVGIMALGYVIFSMTNSLAMVIAGASCVGFSFGVLFPLLLTKINARCTKSNLILALSISSCAQFFGQFASPYVLHGLKVAFGGKTLQHDFIIIAIGLTAAFLILFTAKRSKTLYDYIHPPQMPAREEVLALEND